MTGPHDGVIGIEKATIIARFVTGLPARFETASGDPRMHGVVITVDPSNGRASAIHRLSLSEHELKDLTDGVSAGARG
jgi:calcineurin-like phosphoesterase